MSHSLADKLDKIKRIISQTGIEQITALKELERAADIFLSAIQKPMKEQKSISNSTIKIWSDGACSGNPGPGGWGTIIEIDGQRKELSGGLLKTTNNIMEMTGALEGIRHTPEGSSIVLTSDSQYLIKGMTQWLQGWKKKGWKKADGKEVLNKNLWQELDKESSKRTIQWIWIKGHAGHDENERCDELARQAVKQ